MKDSKIRLLISVLLLAVLLAACGGGLSSGSKVIAKWNLNNWYGGTIEGPCEGGFTVKWEDGSDPACVASAEVKPIKTLGASNAKAGASVFVKVSSGSQYYDGTIGAVEGTMYKVDFPDGSYERDVTVDRLFVR